MLADKNPLKQAHGSRQVKWASHARAISGLANNGMPRLSFCKFDTNSNNGVAYKFPRAEMKERYARSIEN